MQTNDLFERFVKGLFVLLILYGAGMVAVILFGPDVIASRMVAAYTAMFGTTVGLGSGYLLGRQKDGDGDDHQ